MTASTHSSGTSTFLLHLYLPDTWDTVVRIEMYVQKLWNEWRQYTVTYNNLPRHHLIINKDYFIHSQSQQIMHQKAKRDLVSIIISTAVWHSGMVLSSIFRFWVDNDLTNLVHHCNDPPLQEWPTRKRMGETVTWPITNPKPNSNQCNGEPFWWQIFAMAAITNLTSSVMDSKAHFFHSLPVPSQFYNHTKLYCLVTVV